MKGPENTMVLASAPYNSPCCVKTSSLCGCITLKYVKSKKYAQGELSVNSIVLSSTALIPRSSTFALPLLNSLAFFIGNNRKAY